ncbi:type 1 glutamine amidotransferase [Aquisediminimonas sediminicola]|uniref:type 1 glutamine amidotransferase n=1 Tax=Alteraquisediminimonas sediminicola TaxID=2676787 RepID=UPI001C8E1998|nr:type 1 glutamine amidotransferase [Aquisediminimonas sediminicola]
MTRLLLLEGNTADKRAQSRAIGVRSSSEIYAIAISAEFPDIELDILNGADPDGVMPYSRTWSDYDGFVITGSALHAYDTDFAVTNQIALTKEAADHGLPIFGSCWGLQILVMAAGGMVISNPRGREVGIARKIYALPEGRDHQIFGGKGLVFDALCIHYDEVSRLPDNATLLASNSHSRVQAALIPLGRSIAWAVQYHPEFDLQQIVQLYTLYSDDMVAQGFFANNDELIAYRNKLVALAANSAEIGIGWQLGIDEDITDDKRRRAEIIAWIETCVLT